MKIQTFAGLAAAAFLIAAPFGTAGAADMMVKAKAPPPPPFSWTGFYIGGYVGAALTDPATTSDPCTIGAACATVGTYNAVAPLTYDMNPGFTGGGTIGYNWQINPYTVLGVENKFGYMSVKGSIVANPTGLNDTLYSTKIGNWYDAYTARVGAVNGQFMFFLEAGGVTGRFSTSVVDTNPAGATINIAASKTQTGFAGGGGIEYAINSHWSAKAEYLFLGLSSTVTGCATVFAGGVVPGPAACSYTQVSGVQTIDLGLNYRF